MFTAGLFTAAQTRKQRWCPSADGWMQQQRCAHTMEHDSAKTGTEILPPEKTRMHLEGIVLREVNQRKKNAIGLHVYMESKKQNKQAE